MATAAATVLFLPIGEFRAEEIAACGKRVGRMRIATLPLKLPHTGQAVLIDLGESDDPHPRNKKDVGERLARLALTRHSYGRPIVFSGPVYESMKIEGHAIRVKFRHTEQGLVARADFHLIPDGEPEDSRPVDGPANRCRTDAVMRKTGP